MSATAPALPIYQRPEGESLDYIWNGELFRRVTAILGIAPGHYLPRWYGKMASFSTLAPLMHAGMLPGTFNPLLDEDDEYDEVDDLVSFVRTQTYREMSEDEALAEAANWHHHMLQGERNRDAKGRIGSLAHHFLYEHAIGLRVSPDDLVDYCIERTRKLQLLPRDMVARYAEHGKLETTLERELAFATIPYIDSALAWHERFKPDDESTGLESAVFHRAEAYAGTRDGVCVITKRNWEHAGVEWVFEKPVARVVKDYKTSRKLQKSYRFQVAAYARAEFRGDYDTQTEHEIEEVDGLLLLHIRPGESTNYLLIGDQGGISGKDKIDDLFNGFCGLSTYYRAYEEMPSAPRAKKYYAPKPRKGERECPI